MLCLLKVYNESSAKMHSQPYMHFSTRRGACIVMHVNSVLPAVLQQSDVRRNGFSDNSMPQMALQRFIFPNLLLPRTRYCNDTFTAFLLFKKEKPKYAEIFVYGKRIILSSCKLCKLYSNHVSLFALYCLSLNFFSFRMFRCCSCEEQCLCVLVADSIA